MFRFFNELPEELRLEVIRQASRDDQARLTRVSKECDRFANHPSTALFQYKAERYTYVVGDVRLVIEPYKPKFVFNNPYDSDDSDISDDGITHFMYLCRDGKRIHDGSMRLSDEFVEKILIAMTGGPVSLINFLSKQGASSSQCAKCLFDELSPEDQALCDEIKIKKINLFDDSDDDFSFDDYGPFISDDEDLFAEVGFRR